MKRRKSNRSDRELAKEFLAAHPGYQKWGAEKLAGKFNISTEVITEIKAEIKEATRMIDMASLGEDEELFKEFMLFKRAKSLQDIEPEPELPEPYTDGDPNNVLVVGDIHEPFCLEGYLEFCRFTQEKYNCGTVVFIGDVIDNHFVSYHEIETSALGAEDELELAISKLANWYSVFPKATVLIGNHDRLVYRKARTAGISTRWVRGYSDVLGTPGWDFVEEVVIHGVMYVHGESGTASKKMQNEHCSVVQGHLHSQGYVQWSVGSEHRLFGFQVGCGVDRHAYAMAYGKMGPKPVISCGVILEEGFLPILIPMKL